MSIYSPTVLPSRSIVFESKPVKFQKYGFVYIWWNKNKNRYYIGSRWGAITDGYICSSSYMILDYRKNPTVFKRRILAIVDSPKELVEAENYWLDKIKTTDLRRKYYNRSKKASRRVD